MMFFIALVYIFAETSEVVNWVNAYNWSKVFMLSAAWPAVLVFFFVGIAYGEMRQPWMRAADKRSNKLGKKESKA
jgi:hypothetical protein